MWVFDGEEWTQEGEEEKRKPDMPPPPPEEFLHPQLQVAEVVQTNRKR
ncbi:MAG TPA: hypothetical protein VM779_02775 [Thermoanaerobaculia bacterium]|nr:hypothetical protein [Thermoanaerobaculia bacterium]